MADLTFPAGPARSPASISPEVGCLFVCAAASKGDRSKMSDQYHTWPHSALHTVCMYGVWCMVLTVSYIYSIYVC